MMAETERVKGHCPKCGAGKWAEVRGKFERREDDDTAPVSLWTTHLILQCPACDTVYHQTDSVFSEDIVYTENPHTGETEFDYEHTIRHWPSSSGRPQPTWLSGLGAVDFDLYRLLDEVYLCLANDLYVSSAIGMRTAFDRASEVLGIDPAISFGEKLDALVDGGWIGTTERVLFSTLTDAGNAAAHRGWKPSAEDLDSLMTVLEALIERHFVVKDKIAKLAAAVPAKPKRRAT